MGLKPRPGPDGNAAVHATVTVTSAGDGAPLFVEVPPAFARALGTASRVAVTGALNNARFDSALIPLGGRLRLVINRELATRAGVYRGALARLQLTRIPEPG